MKSKITVSPETARVGRLAAKSVALLTCSTLRSWLRVILHPACAAVGHQSVAGSQVDSSIRPHHNCATQAQLAIQGS